MLRFEIKWEWGPDQADTLWEISKLSCVWGGHLEPGGVDLSPGEVT